MIAISLVLGACASAPVETRRSATVVEPDLTCSAVGEPLDVEAITEPSFEGTTLSVAYRVVAADAAHLERARVRVHVSDDERESIVLGPARETRRRLGAVESWWIEDVELATLRPVLDVRADVECGDARATSGVSRIEGPDARGAWCGYAGNGRAPVVSFDVVAPGEDVVVLEARCGVMLRLSRGALIDACDGETLLRLDGLPLADVRAPEDLMRLTTGELASLAARQGCEGARAQLRFSYERAEVGVSELAARVGAADWIAGIGHRRSR
ncbi:hypothetical protein [Sandaracinus amylolyticus]|uniref:hypothetical protein n=1 Tax=Sandaracinus amylolyticus TaxID=927083 RepID=UPI001470578A|nr:hypothetical protein [Sandaracinus amylolyticus]